MKLQIRAVLVLITFLCLTSGLYADTNSADAVTASEELRLADVAWAKSAEKQDVEKFYGTILDDVRLLAPNQAIAEGLEAMKQTFDFLFGLPEFSITWKPVLVHVSASEDLGYTMGLYELSYTGPDGKPVVDKGKYMTVWKKSSDGSWKVAADMFNTNIPLQAASPEGQ